MKLEERLFSLRKEKNKTQEEIATALNVTRQTVSNWETGNAQPSIDKAIDLAKLYEVSLDELVGIQAKVVVSDLLLSLIGKTCSIYLRLGTVEGEDYGLEITKSEYKNAKIIEVSSQFIRFEYKDKKQNLEKMLFLDTIAYIEKGDE